MISGNITLDKLLEDIEQQIEILHAIAADNAILNEQLRLLHESKDMLLYQELEMGRLEELIDPDDLQDHSSLMDRQVDQHAED